MKSKRVPLTVSLPATLAKEFDRVAKDEAKNKSQLFREMFRAYRRGRAEQEFFEVQRYGARLARARSILTEADVEALVLDSR